MNKIYRIAYQNEDPKKDDYCLLKFAEVAASNSKQAKEIFFRYHHKSNRICKIEIKRTGGIKKC